MAITWSPNFDSTTQLSDLLTPLRVNYRDKSKGRQGSLGPVRHCGENRITAAKAVLDILEPHSAMLISSVEMVLGYNAAGFVDSNIPSDPGADNPPLTFTFRVRPASGQPYTDKIYLPAVKGLTSASQKETLGQSLAAAVAANLPTGWTIEFIA